MKDPDQVRFEELSQEIRTLSEEFLEEFWGEKCEEFDENCYICQRWQALEDLLYNPF